MSTDVSTAAGITTCQQTAEASRHVTYARQRRMTTNVQIVCMIYNKYNPSETIYVKHSSLEKHCPSLQAQLTKYKQNTEY
jgi:hypothetical protein